MEDKQKTPEYEEYNASLDPDPILSDMSADELYTENYGGIYFAKAQGVDVMISADYKHHFIAQALEMGVAVIVLTHYSAEAYGFEKYYEKVRRQTDILCIYHADEELF